MKIYYEETIPSTLGRRSPSETIVSLERVFVAVSPPSFKAPSEKNTLAQGKKTKKKTFQKPPTAVTIAVYQLCLAALVLLLFFFFLSCPQAGTQADRDKVMEIKTEKEPSH